MIQLCHRLALEGAVLDVNAPGVLQLFVLVGVVDQQGVSFNARASDLILPARCRNWAAVTFEQDPISRGCSTCLRPEAHPDPIVVSGGQRNRVIAEQIARRLECFR